MKHIVLSLFLCAFVTAVSGQITQDATKQLRIYEDDDFFNIWGRGTDRGYSNGSGASYLYMKEKKSVFLDKWILAKAGPNAINVYEWGLMQVMITPNQIADSSFIPSDFYYAGALFATHGLTSYNPEKKYSLHSEFVFGVLGPWALAKETQTFFHHLIGYQSPMGWEYQVPNAPLINYNFTYERMLWDRIKSLEILGSVNIRAGTMTSGISALSYIRFGIFNPYFGNRNLATATRRRFQLYAIARPQFSFTAYNALLQGGIFKSRDTNFEQLEGNQKTHMRRFSIGMDYGIAIVVNRMSLSYTQKTHTEWMSGTGKHSVGNITLLIPISRKTIINK
ncbi:lipid A-modifier LpxR family protein [Chitinophaga sp. 22321]|uniref:Lipid A deacylase LpxR family protein n=1 Tax=Chitinophaga hostae TaxID=2831022 RepID=A0ABS5IRZ4_9BACT|nr:lipid A deacylase LpxR family protein [Chitinophaga hostae]MBS0025696.1 lipid A deacylase LpxR family protein [Chitinophaga hostae]